MLQFRAIHPDNKDDLSLLVGWYGQPAIRPFIFPHSDDLAYRRPILAENIRARLSAKPKALYRAYIITMNDKPIGEMSIELNSDSLKKTKPKSAWVGVVIGDPQWRGKGLGSKIMQTLEAIAMEMGALRIELGVFEFNEPAIRLYERLGYLHFDEKRHATWWNGKYWPSLHMEKSLVRLGETS